MHTNSKVSAIYGNFSTDQSQVNDRNSTERGQMLIMCGESRNEYTYQVWSQCDERFAHKCMETTWPIRGAVIGRYLAEHESWSAPLTSIILLCEYTKFNARISSSYLGQWGKTPGEDVAGVTHFPIDQGFNKLNELERKQVPDFNHTINSLKPSDAYMRQ